MMAGGITLLLVLLAAGVAAEDDGVSLPVVKTRQGIARGRSQISRAGRRFLAFYNLPYAKPPVGPLRFRDPQPAEGWSEVRNATVPGNICPQASPLQDDRGSEDCLYLNIFTPQLTPTKPLPVMFWIHGGGFMFGDARSYEPDYLLDQDIVLVTINYRLGSLGFLCTEDDIIPGNFGLKDQVAAMKWVKENVEAFGGDPNSVTLFGESAGGASVHYHLLSPLSRGLFHRGISQSGTALAVWALPDSDAFGKAQKLAKIFGCPTEKSSDLADCLRNVETHQLISADDSFKNFATTGISFRPAVENNKTGSFLPKHPRLLKPADVPWMVGVTENEGAYLTGAIYMDKNALLHSENNLKKGLPFLLHYNTFPNASVITDKIYTFYFPQSTVFIKALTDVYTDVLFLLSTDEAVRLRNNMSSVFYYLFAYSGTNRITKSFGESDFDFGAGHTDDLFYLFPKNPHAAVNYKLSEKDEKFSFLMAQLWTNFAKSGNPTPQNQPLEWTPVDSDDDLEYLVLGEKLEMKRGLFQNRVNFFKSLFLTHTME